MQTLTTIARALGPGFDEDAVHTALLLSFVQSAYGVVRTLAAPSPLYRLGFDEATNHVSLEETGGSSQVPRDGTADISDLDVLLISNLRDIPVLLEGETGVGKTFVSQAYLRAVFPQESAVSLRLSGSVFLNNVFQPFLEGRIEQGMPVTRIKQAAVDAIGALFVDEINRGDPQSILQLLDCELYNAGVFTRLGLPIPRLAGTAAEASGRRKKLFIVGAQNPAASDDARFTGTVELDAAVDNRLLKIRFGNAARSVGSTLWLTEEVPKPFEAFLSEYAAQASRYLGVPLQAQALADDWLSVYAFVTDPARTDKPVLYSALELTDVLTTVLGGDLPGTHAYELGVIHDWNRELGARIEVREEARLSEKVKQVHEIVATFEVPVIFRDVVQIKKLADVLATLLSLRQALSSSDPVAAYLSLHRFVSVREVAGATALLARSKQTPKAPSPTPLVNEVLLQYTTLTERYAGEVGYVPARFDRGDPNLGLKRLAIARAARAAMKHRGDAAAFAGAIVGEVERLGRHRSATDEIGNLLVSKTQADLLTLAGFLHAHESGTTAALRALGPAASDSEVVREVARLYVERRRSHAPVLPDIFQHRIPRTLGV